MLTEIASGVFVHESECLQTNSVAVVGDSGVLLVDPGLTRDELAGIARDLRERELSVVAGFSTHPDWDHVLWHVDLGDAPRWATARGAASIAAFLTEPDWPVQLAEALPPEIADDVPRELLGLVTALPAGATEVPWDGPSARVLEHRAHATGHAALLIADRRVLIAGDMVSDVLIPMLDHAADDPTGDYLAALDLLESVADQVDVVVPGHGSSATGPELRTRVAQDRAYVEALRARREPDDPRLTSPRPGWEWVRYIHEGQAS